MIDAPDTIALNDPTSWNTLLPAFAVEKAGKNVRCFVEDAAAPWLEGHEIGIRRKWPWPHRHRIASRFPWSPTTPDLHLESVAATLKTPWGLHYLIGPPDGKSAFEHEYTPELQEAARRLLQEEERWARVVAEWMGDDDPDKPLADFPKQTPPLRVAQGLAGILGTQAPESAVLFFQESPSRLAQETALPERYFRKSPGGVMVPKPAALPLEWAARGHHILQSNEAFSNEIRSLRDTYLPGVSLRVATIVFNWELATDPLEALVAAYRKKKQERGTPFQEPRLEELDAIRTYWQTHPTTVSYLVLGGTLNPSLTFHDY